MSRAKKKIKREPDDENETDMECVVRAITDRTAAAAVVDLK